MIKVAIACALLGVASCAIIAGHPAAIVGTGASAQFRSQDIAGNYNFGYNEDHATGGTFRRESGNALGQVVGSYGLRDADGRVRTVNYVADALGFRANINSNEPGVEPKDPAAVAINKGAVVAAAPVAPLVAAPAVHAPVHAPVLARPAAPLLAAEPAHYAAAPAHGPVAVAGPAFSTSYQTVISSHGVPAAPLVAAPAAPVAQLTAAPLAAPWGAPVAAPVAPRFGW